MGYYIRELKNKSQLPHWKIQFITYKKSETQSSNAEKPRKEWDISKTRWNLTSWLDEALRRSADRRSHRQPTRASQPTAQLERRKLPREITIFAERS
jgi:hypothetical protein